MSCGQSSGCDGRSLGSQAYGLGGMQQWTSLSQWHQPPKRPRAMQASDLGLPCDCDRIDCRECHARWTAKHAAPVQASVLARAAKCLEFGAARLVDKYGESPNVDFVLAMRESAAAIRPNPLDGTRLWDNS